MGSKVFTATIFFFIGVLAACGGSSGADGGDTTGGGLTEKQVNKLIDKKLEAYQQRIADLEGAVETLSGSVNVVVARDTSTARTANGQQKTGTRMTRIQKLADAESIGCTLGGWLPASQKEAVTMQCKTPNGYQFDLPWPQGGAPTKINVYYEQPGCMGTPYTPRHQVEDGARAQGVIATYYDGTGSHVGMVVAGTPVVTRTAASLHNGSACVDLTPTEIRDDLIEVVAHPVDPDTGVNSTSGGKNSYPAIAVQ